MTWNYRLIEHSDGTVAIHEVYYEQRTPRMCSENPVAFTVDSQEEVDEEFDRWQAAVRKPVLSMSLFEVGADA